MSGEVIRNRRRELFAREVSRELIVLLNVGDQPVHPVLYVQNEFSRNGFPDQNHLMPSTGSGRERTRLVAGPWVAITPVVERKGVWSTVLDVIPTVPHIRRSTWTQNAKLVEVGLLRIIHEVNHVVKAYVFLLVDVDERVLIAWIWQTTPSIELHDPFRCVVRERDYARGVRQRVVVRVDHIAVTETHGELRLTLNGDIEGVRPSLMSGEGRRDIVDAVP